LVSVKGDNSESWITFWIVKAVFIFPHVSLTAQELSGKLFGEIPRVTYPLKAILLADSIRSRLLSWFGSPIIKKIPEYHPPNVYGCVEI
jgi:hypothetical protein